MSAIQREIHNTGDSVQTRWNAYFQGKEIHEILYDIVGAVVSCVAVMLFFSNPYGTLLTLGISSLSAYGLSKINMNADLKAALMLLVAPILGAVAAHFIGYPVCYFAAVLIQSATLWAASKVPTPQVTA